MQTALLMRRCLDLARLGKFHNRTNPQVGAIRCDSDGRILNEGYYRHYGGPHAEVMCLGELDVVGKDEHLFVSLEPCNIHAKTPPCLDIILSKGVPQVHVSCADPNPQIAGTSLLALENSGVEVQSGILEPEGQDLLRPFLVNTTQKRPYLILKWAESADGFIATTDGPTKLSNWASDRLVHRWRAEVDAILIGTQTAVLDNPRLTTRHWFGPSPLRIVLDRLGKVPRTHRLFDSSAPTLIMGARLDMEAEEHAQFKPYQDRTELPLLINDLLRSYQVGSLLVEGGAELLTFLLEANCWDEIRRIRTNHRLGGGVQAPIIHQAAAESTSLLKDRIEVFYNQLGLKAAS